MVTEGYLNGNRKCHFGQCFAWSFCGMRCANLFSDFSRLQGVLPCLDHVLGDLTAERDGVRAVVLGEAAEDGELSTLHIALGYGSDDLACGELDLFEGGGGVDAGHGDWYRASLAC